MTKFFSFWPLSSLNSSLVSYLFQHLLIFLINMQIIAPVNQSIYIAYYIISPRYCIVCYNALPIKTHQYDEIIYYINNNKLSPSYPDCPQGDRNI